MDNITIHATVTVHHPRWSSHPSSDSPHPVQMSSKPVLIPWSFLSDSNVPKVATKDGQNQPYIRTKTFAQALNTVCNIPQSQLPKPSVKGDDFAIVIPEEEYELGLQACKLNLHAWIMWPKGSTPLTVVALREKLKSHWKHLGRWGIASLGKISMN